MNMSAEPSATAITLPVSATTRFTTRQSNLNGHNSHCLALLSSCSRHCLLWTAASRPGGATTNLET